VEIPLRSPAFARKSGVTLEIAPRVAVAGRDTIQYRVSGLESGAVDLLFTLDAEQMPPIRNIILYKGQSAPIYLGAMTHPGLYHFIGIRSSNEAGPETWISVDVSTQVR
jgi:hypothetical protein